MVNDAKIKSSENQFATSLSLMRRSTRGECGRGTNSSASRSYPPGFRYEHVASRTTDPPNAVLASMTALHCGGVSALRPRTAPGTLGSKRRGGRAFRVVVAPKTTSTNAEEGSVDSDALAGNWTIAPTFMRSSVRNGPLQYPDSRIIAICSAPSRLRSDDERLPAYSGATVPDSHWVPGRGQNRRLRTGT